MQAVQDGSSGFAIAPPPGVITAAVIRAAALPLSRFRLEWTAADGVDARQFLGSAWRGVFGHELRRLVCVTRAPQCTGCMLHRSCSYPFLFETPGEAQTTGSATSKAAPHPMVLRMESAGCRAGGPYAFSFVLAGHATRFLGYAVRAFQEAGERGVTAQEVRFRLRQVLQEAPVGSGNWRPILNAERKLSPLPAVGVGVPPQPGALRMRLISPMRLRKEGSYVSGEDSLGEILVAILRRLLLMAEFHGEGAVEEDLAPLFHRARSVRPLSAALRWHDWTRYSNRQQTKMQMGGLVGEICFSMDAIPEMWPALWAGQYLHAGKGTSMGLGAYTLEGLAE